MEVSDTLEDEGFRDSPQVQGPPYVRFYAGSPIVGTTGHHYGTLCVVDMKPRTLTLVQRTALQRLSRLATVLLEEHKRKRRSEEVHARLRAIVQGSLGVGIITTDTEGLITVFNPGAEEMLGYGAEEMVGRESPARFHLPGEIEARGRELSEAEGVEITGCEVFTYIAKKRGIETRRWTYVRKDGRHRQVRLSLSALRHDDGELFGYLGMAVDLSEQFEAQEAAPVDP